MPAASSFSPSNWRAHAEATHQDFYDLLALHLYAATPLHCQLHVCGLGAPGAEQDSAAWHQAAMAENWSTTWGQWLEETLPAALPGVPPDPHVKPVKTAARVIDEDFSAVAFEVTLPGHMTPQAYCDALAARFPTLRFEVGRTR